MYILTKQCGHLPWTRHGRLALSFKEQQEDIAIYRTRDDADKAAVQIATDEGVLLQVVCLRDYIAKELKTEAKTRKELRRCNVNAKYLPCERTFTCKENGEKAGKTLFLVVDRGYVRGVIVQMCDGEMTSFIDEEFCYEFEAFYKLSTEITGAASSLSLFSSN